MRVSRTVTRTALLLLVCGTVSCGRKTQLHAPDDVLPETITDLKASNTSDGIELSWSRPTTYADGSRMNDLGGFVIERADGTDLLKPFRPLVTLEVTDRDRFRQIKHFRQIDRDTNQGWEYSYRVVSFTLDRYFSEPSNIVTVERASANEEKHAPLPTPRG